MTAWKFHLGDAGQKELCPADAFMSYDNMYCVGWAHQAAYQLTEDECRRYCCGDPACAGWTMESGWCSIGHNSTGCVKVSGGSTGGLRTTPAPIITPAADGPQSTGYDDSSWRTVELPHDYVVEMPPSASGELNHGFRPKNVSWYRLSFDLQPDEAYNQVWLEFDGVYRSSDFWLNGKFLGHHSSGYTSFRWALDRDSGARFGGTNVIAVRLDPRANEGWWYEGAGLYRPVRLVSTSAAGSSASIRPFGVYVPSSVSGAVDRSGAPRADAAVTINTALELPTTENKQLTVSSAIMDPSGKGVWSEEVAASANVVQNLTLRAAQLWEQPAKDGDVAALYSLVTSLKAEGVAVDQVTTTFGVRKAEYTADRGFILNDKVVKVRGMCNHQDFAGIGTAVPPGLQDFRVRKLQSLGVNAWRMSHNPPDPALLDAADRRGLMVWDENRMFGDFVTWYDDQADMIMRDRNHPSIMCVGRGNAGPSLTSLARFLPL